jgi:hypothetical protein
MENHCQRDVDAACPIKAATVRSGYRNFTYSRSGAQQVNQPIALWY